MLQDHDYKKQDIPATVSLVGNLVTNSSLIFNAMKMSISDRSQIYQVSQCTGYHLLNTWSWPMFLTLHCSTYSQGMDHCFLAKLYAKGKAAHQNMSQDTIVCYGDSGY